MRHPAATPRQVRSWPRVTSGQPGTVRAGGWGAGGAEQLQHALDSRVIIQQAKGILAERDGISPSEAFDRLRKHARAHPARIHDVAAQVVDGTPTL